MPSFSKALPPTRSTGDAPNGGVAGDVNLLTEAVAEVRDGVVSMQDVVAAVADQGSPLHAALVALVGSGSSPAGGAVVGSAVVGSSTVG